MRALVILAFVLAACSPPPPTPAPAPEPPPEVIEANPEYETLAAAALPGEWFTSTSDAGPAACFGAPQSECVFSIGCHVGSGRVSVFWSHELFPDQDVELKLIAATGTMALPARSFNEGLPSVNADTTAARLAPLARSQERFGVEIRGEVSAVPWNESVATVIAACD
jgi:hypothetical protein